MLGAVGLLGMALTGCTPSEDGARAELERKAVVIDAAAQDVLQALDAAELADPRAAGALDGCGGSLTGWGVAYRAGASAQVGADPRAAIDAVASELEGLGWTDEGEIGGDHPTARLTRDGITIALKTGGFTSGGTLHEADRLTAGISSLRACVMIPEGASAADFAEFERDIAARE